jgi:hypothetical protein
VYDQAAAGLAHKFRVPDHFACRERGKVLDPDIHTNRIACLWKESGLVLLNSKNHIPTVSLSLNRAGLDRPFDRTRKTDPARTDFRQVEFVALILSLYLYAFTACIIL